MNKKKKLIGNYLYLEFIFPIKDYLSTISLKEGFFDWVFPAIGAYVLHNTLIKFIDFDKLNNISTQLLSLLAILVGFTITSITILVASSSANIEKLKLTPSDKIISGKNISLYKEILGHMTYVLINELITIILCLVFYLFASIIKNSCLVVFFSIIVFLIIHIILLNIRNVANFYFTFWDDSNKSETEDEEL